MFAEDALADVSPMVISLFLISIDEVAGLSFFSLSPLFSPSVLGFFLVTFPVPFFPFSSSAGSSVTGGTIFSLNLYSGSCQTLSAGNSGNVNF